MKPNHFFHSLTDLGPQTEVNGAWYTRRGAALYTRLRRGCWRAQNSSSARASCANRVAWLDNWMTETVPTRDDAV